MRDADLLRQLARLAVEAALREEGDRAVEDLALAVLGREPLARGFDGHVLRVFGCVFHETAVVFGVVVGGSQFTSW
ncbi:hypothetical protein [Variovorax sp. UC122_21]|uniref:hypothetical protein n=1 Tax=Variovorax sp. UC122_21 TaxID=3374554 RepID=UPI003756510B